MKIKGLCGVDKMKKTKKNLLNAERNAKSYWYKEFVLRPIAKHIMWLLD